MIMDLGTALHDYVSHVKASGGASYKVTILKSAEQESEMIEKYIEKDW